MEGGWDLVGVPAPYQVGDQGRLAGATSPTAARAWRGSRRARVRFGEDEDSSTPSQGPWVRRRHQRARTADPDHQEGTVWNGAGGRVGATTVGPGHTLC